MPKINYASSMIVEDHLKKLLTMTRGKAWKFTDNKMLPRSQHSPFGDFPPEYMKDVGKKDTTPVPLIENAEQSIAATGKGKFFSRYEAVGESQSFANQAQQASRVKWIF